MTKPTSTTSEQLRKLMQSHVENAAAKPEPILKSPEAITQHPRAVITSAKPVATMPLPAATRYSLRLLAPEISKINSVIQNTLEQTGERVTLTDVLRVGIGRVGDSSPISRHELVLLRKTDGRRTKPQG